ncbi:hypothetical protein XA68_11697 [Ophiocordyceps unilateralis]|uniref:Uncharacterized protein n=1 Tax=Ophiocordyceps unilateralis TaxID=268505 RepID=A0A2A9PF17_OPHUN|nr:hypothetical protein XA68_11697 [Ophiocordyceps unilateralis]
MIPARYPICPFGESFEFDPRRAGLDTFRDEATLTDLIEKFRVVCSHKASSKKASSFVTTYQGQAQAQGGAPSGSSQPSTTPANSNGRRPRQKTCFYVLPESIPARLVNTITLDEDLLKKVRERVGNNRELSTKVLVEVQRLKEKAVNKVGQSTG